jgi:hypothetical protein
MHIHLCICYICVITGMHVKSGVFADIVGDGAARIKFCSILVNAMCSYILLSV